jgi:3-dehydrosphinganine reductase
MDFRGANVIITGGSSGIGKATAKLLAADGASVFIIARDEGKLGQAVREIERERVSPDQRVGAFKADVRSYEEVEAAVADITEAGGPPDILINSAGIDHPGYFEELPLSAFRDMMDTNYFGTLHAVKAALPHMMAKRSGHIVNISSIAGFLGVFGYTAYGASKFAVLGFTEALRSELKPHNIGVSVLCPFDTDTPQLWAESGLRPLETKMIVGTVRPEKLNRPTEFVALGLAKLFSGSAEPTSPEHTAAALLTGIRRKRYLIIPEFGMKAVYYIGRVLAPLANWVVDQMVALARRQRGAQ